MKKLIIANWKMNPSTLDEARRLFASWEHRKRTLNKNTEVVVCAPLIYLPFLSHIAHDVQLAAQNMSWAEKGPLTGEVSATQLKEFNVKYIIIGHSERRMYLGETDSVVNAKIIAALKHKLTPILCLGGEEGAIKTEMKTLVTKQFIKSTKGLDKRQLQKIVYVYEPSWAISTMRHAEPDTGENANELIEHVYSLLKHRLGKKASKLLVLYGGSVNKGNVSAYAKFPKISGALVGAASLDSENFWQVVTEFNREEIHARSD